LPKQRPYQILYYLNSFRYFRAEAPHAGQHFTPCTLWIEG